MLAGTAEAGLDDIVPVLDIKHYSSYSQGGGTISAGGQYTLITCLSAICITVIEVLIRYR